MQKPEVVVGVRRPGGRGKKSRKLGKGTRKISRSKWHSYSVLIAHQQDRRATTNSNRAERFARYRKLRICTLCGTTGFHSKRALRRHRKLGGCDGKR